MFLISKFVYDAMAKSSLHKDTPYLYIENSNPDNHYQTHYKFRYGATDENGKVGKADVIKLKPNSAKRIWSMESFKLSERVVAIFGHPSNLFMRGLELIHSPFIDPRFSGNLQLVIRNFSDETVELVPGDIIGKIIFFDVSDTIISAKELLDEFQINTKVIVREQAVAEMSEVIKRLRET